MYTITTTVSSSVGNSIPLGSSAQSVGVSPSSPPFSSLYPPSYFPLKVATNLSLANGLAAPSRSLFVPIFCIKCLAFLSVYDIFLWTRRLDSWEVLCGMVLWRFWACIYTSGYERMRIVMSINTRKQIMEIFTKAAFSHMQYQAIFY